MPYGSWKSPITSDLIVSGGIRLGGIQVDGEAIYWLEGRPSENGRNALVKWSADEGIEEMTPAGYNIRSRVHEYGGGAFTVHDDTLYFSNFVDQRLYVQYPYSEADPLSANKNIRFANGVVDETRGRLFAIREDHRGTDTEAVNTLVSINLDGVEEEGDLLAGGNDFYASPALSSDGEKIAWLTWNHPNMPWDGTELWVGELDAAGTAVINPIRIAGGETESIFQPRWSPDGSLYFISDRNNWWNLYRWHKGKIEELYAMDAEFGVPQWTFALSTYDFIDADTLICTYTQNGRWQLAQLDLQKKILTPIESPYTHITYLHAGAGFVTFLGGSSKLPSAIVRLDLESGAQNVLRQSTQLSIDPSYFSAPQSIEFPTEHGLTAHAIYYPPNNPDFVAPEGELPPLLVLSHGGPTSATSRKLNLGVQYWTSRGFAVVDVNYGGSTGYGRTYRQRLHGKWGIVDVDDCTNAARYLVAQGLADGQRLAIRGGSAGGYTTLCALTFKDVFHAGASHFGISDIEILAQETHKFESRYDSSLIGAYPEEKETYYQRSPIHFADQINCPLILFQGLEDKVVPPNQSEMMYEAVRQKGVPVAYVAYEGEQHGFRKAENIKHSLDSELYFYSKIFNFALAEPVEVVQIDNLEGYGVATPNYCQLKCDTLHLGRQIG